MAKNRINIPIDLVTITAAVIVVAFFMPWVKYGVSYSGYEIPGIARMVAKLASFKTWTGHFDINVYLVYLLFIVPLGAVVVLVLSVMNKPARIPAMVVAALPLAGFIYGLIRVGFKIFSYIGIGGWLTIIAAAVMALSLAGIIRLPGRGARRR